MKRIFFEAEYTGYNPKEDLIAHMALLYEENGVITDVASYYPLHVGRLAPAVSLLEKQNWPTPTRECAPQTVSNRLRTFLREHISFYDKEDKATLVVYSSGLGDQFLRDYLGESFGNYFWSTPIDVATLLRLYVEPEAHKYPRVNLDTIYPLIVKTPFIKNDASLYRYPGETSRVVKLYNLFRELSQKTLKNSIENDELF